MEKIQQGKGNKSVRAHMRDGERETKSKSKRQGRVHSTMLGLMKRSGGYQGHRSASARIPCQMRGVCTAPKGKPDVHTFIFCLFSKFQKTQHVTW